MNSYRQNKQLVHKVPKAEMLLTPSFLRDKGKHMARSNNQKGKILYLERMLRETGENRAVSMQEILESLLEKGIRAERKSIYDDMEVLRTFGMNIQYRREKPSGYYLAGQMAAEEQKKVDDLQEVNTEAELLQMENIPEKLAEEVRAYTPTEETIPDRDGWKKRDSREKDVHKPMRLLCTGESMEAVRDYFGTSAEYKEKENGDYLVTTALLEDKNFYGWLTAMGRDVHLLKPKKAAQAYREYLKMLAKDYK